MAFFSPLQLNLLDLVIVAVFLFYAYEGYMIGFLLALTDLLSFILSFVLALILYDKLARVLILLFPLPVGFANALSFFFLALLTEVLLGLLLRKLARKVPRINEDNNYFKLFSRLNHFLGVLPGVASASIILTFLLSVIIALPSSPVLKHAVSTSKIGSYLLSNTAFAEKGLNDIFGGALHETLTFFTIEPKSTESVKLNFTVENGSIEPEEEELMLTMVNSERSKNGLAELVMDEPLRRLARRYSDDMLKKGYFSHVDQNGKSPFERMDEAGIEYTSAGENLALAPETKLAMTGLMNSPGHRANILKPEFRKIGIGVIDGGIYGKMFTQEFTN